MKALDIWMIMCVIDVFLTLLAHTVIFKLVEPFCMSTYGKFIVVVIVILCRLRSMQSKAHQGSAIHCAMCKEVGTDEETQALSPTAQADGSESGQPESSSSL